MAMMSMESKRAAACVISNEADSISDSIASKLGAKRIKAEIRVFSDGESKIRLDANIPKNSKVIIVQSLHIPVDTNLFRALCLLSKAKESTSDITIVIPYMGYARQDAEFLKGEIVTVKIIGTLLKKAGAVKIIIVDIHSAKGLALLGRHAKNVTAIPALAKYFATTMQQYVKNPIVVSPDKGGAQRAQQFAKELGCDHITLEKSRDRKTGTVHIKTKKASAVRDKDAIIIDDMISTGGSIIKSAQFLKSQHSNRVFAACTHALLVDGARTKIKKAGVDKIISTNTIPNTTTSKVDVSDAIMKAIEGKK